MNDHFFYGFQTEKWSLKTSGKTTKLCDKITTEVFSVADDEIWGGVLSLYFLCAFSNLHDQARGLLEAYFDAAGPDFDLKSVPDTKPMLGSIWAHAPATKPANVPWSDVAGFDPAQLPQYDIAKPEFFQLYRWTDIPSNMPGAKDPDDKHAWKTSQNHIECALCARLLCRVPEGQVAPRDAVREAYDALDRVCALPMLKPGEQANFEEWPSFWVPHGFHQVFPPAVYFCLAVGLGKPEKAREIFMADGPNPGLFSMPALYSIWLGKSHDERLIDEPVATPAADALTAALISRKQYGRQEHLPGVGWPELLRRFSEAALKANPKEYSELENPPQAASDILNPPITPEKLAEVEQRLGPLPPDMREMVQVANGFRGGWHLFGGGFPAVDTLEEAGADDYILTLQGNGLFDNPTRDALQAPVWIGERYDVSDNFVHIVCPADTWRKLIGGDHPAAGEYRVVYTAHWMGFGGDAFRSIRHWIATETVEMERLLERRQRGERHEDDKLYAVEDENE